VDDVQILQGDVREQLQALPAGKVQCVVTSPPYWGLRDYGIKGQLGLEPTPEEYVANMVEVFREVRRILRDDGTCWVNLGDSMLPNKCEAMIPHRVAMALMEDGWICRQTVIWHKPNPMPESVTDRCTKAHEYIFLLTKSARYFYDNEAVREQNVSGNSGWAKQRANGVNTSQYITGEHQYHGGQTGLQACDPTQMITRNRRSVWTVATQPFSGAHFAVFPPKLIEPCILAGTSERGCCPTCGKPWVRVVERAAGFDDAGRCKACGESRSKHKQGPKSSLRPQAALMNSGTTTMEPDGAVPCGLNKTTNWRPGCECGGEPVPCIVLDPFLGSGTALAVAVGLGRRGIGVELNPAYVEMAERRIAAVQRPLLLVT